MTEDRFQQAVALAYESGLLFAPQHGIEVHAESADEYLLFYEMGFEWVGDYTKAPHENIKALLDRAETEPAARSLLRRHVARKLRHLVTLTIPECVAAARFLDETFPPFASRTGPKQARHFDRDFHIYALVRHITEAFDLPLSRNNAAKVHHSACDATATGFTKAKSPLTFSAVKTIAFRDDLRARITDYLSLKAQGKIR